MGGAFEDHGAVLFTHGIGLEDRLHRDPFFLEQLADCGLPHVLLAVVDENGVLVEVFHHAVEIETGVCLDVVGDRIG